MESLDSLRPGTSCVVQEVRGSGPIHTRMRDMGIIRGVEIKVVRAAPLGDPIEFEVKGYNLSLRKKEAKMVMVQVQTDAA